ncbi:polysaccharide deacetylase family protein [Maribacter sp.]|nr:polysaccharide deacetylase family protein [Maribacter sp.]
MLLIYTHKITPRFRYTMQQVFTRILGVEIKYTTKVEDFIKHTGPKITYTNQPLQNEFFVRSNDLLFERGINAIEIVIGTWEEVPCFFRSGEGSAIPFDIFSASFYLLSRYEEYAPHMKDNHGRFPPRESLAYRNNFLKTPVVDLWALKFLEKLKERFPNITHKQRKYKHVSVLDVTTSHAFAHRGFLRGVSGFVVDLFTLKLRRVSQRTKTWFNSGKDPYDNFSELVDLHKKFKVDGMFFFQFAEYSTYDKNVSTNSNKFRFLIKSIADYSTIALAASYSSFSNIELLRKEKKRLSDVINRPVNCSRMRYNRVDLPETYRGLAESEFTDDYTMGYTHETGFRAGTCTPFYFYDINLEIRQPIRVHPFAVHDYAFINLTNRAEILDKIAAIYEEVKKVDGKFITIFSNELLGGSSSVNWLDLYRTILDKHHV